MRLYLFILGITVLQVHASVYSQNTLLNLKLENTTIAEVFDAVENQSEFFFFYNKGQINDKEIVSVDLTNCKIDDVLTSIFGKDMVSYEIYGKNIIIKAKDVTEETAASGQQGNQVTGKVTDDTGQPLPGASVVIKGTTIGVITDLNGNYNLSAPVNAKLVFSFVGMNNAEVTVGANKNINVQLVTSTVGVEEVVVTAMGITKAKKSLAYSVSEVKNDDLVKGGNTNLMKSLDGKISGVNITSMSSDPTSSVLVNIRGTTVMPSATDANVSSKGQPLYVIDGIPVGTQTFTTQNGVDFGNILSQLNPQDIENITVLKGGSAGALYGSEGGNGVVMITTKSGKGGKKGIGVSISNTTTWDTPYQFIKEQTLYGQGERSFEWQSDNTDTYGPKLDGKYSGEYWDIKNQKFVTGPMTSPMEDRMKAYLQTGSTSTTNVAVTGNYDKGSFRLSLSNMGNVGVMPNTKTNQKSVTMNTEYKLTDKIKITAEANYIRTYSPNKANVVGSNSILNDLLFNTPANIQPLGDMKNYWMTGFEGIYMNPAIWKSNKVDISMKNPWWRTYENINIFTRDNVFGKLQMDWKLNNDFNLMIRSGMENVNENFEYRQSFGAVSNPVSRASSGDGQFLTSTNRTLSVNSDVILSFNKTVGKFDITANGGVNYAYNSGNSYAVNANSLSVPGLFQLGNAFPGKLSIPSTSYETAGYGWNTGKSTSVYATADVAWNKQLFLGVTGRNDWKGNLAEEKINYFYPSVSASWVVNETFALPKSINLLKVRLGWANVGNGLSKVRNIDKYAFESPDWSNNVKTATVSPTLVDPDIKPMMSVTKEVGFDLWMLNRMVAFDFTYFIKDQNNQLGSVPLVQGTGFTGMTANVGDVENKGFEMGLTLNPVRTKDWNWDITATFTHYKAKIKRLSPKFAPNGFLWVNYDGKTVVKLAEGEEIGNIYEQNPILRVKTGKYAGMALLDGEAGEFQNGASGDRAKLGNYNPDYLMGLNTTLRYKQLSLNLVGSFRMGGKYVSVNQQYMDSNGRSVESISSGANNPLWSGGRDASTGGHAWPAAGSSQFEAINNNNDGQRTDAANDASYAKGVFINPNFTGTTPTDADYIVNGADPKNTFYQFTYNSFGDCIWNFTSTRTYEATNFKLREVSLTYSVPNALTSKFKIFNVNLALIGRNVFQWNASGRNEDPESAFSGVGQNQGILRATLPAVRSVGFKLGLDF